DESAPEIVVLGIEEMDLDPRPLPSDPTTPDRRSIGRTTASRAPQTAGPTHRTPQAAGPASGAPVRAAEQVALAPGEDICRLCKSHFDTEFCPYCGTRRPRQA